MKTGRGLVDGLTHSVWRGSVGNGDQWQHTLLFASRVSKSKWVISDVSRHSSRCLELSWSPSRSVRPRQ